MRKEPLKGGAHIQAASPQAEELRMLAKRWIANPPDPEGTLGNLPHIAVSRKRRPLG
jgi:hypothetical protein